MMQVEFKDVLIESKAFQWKDEYRKHCPIELENHSTTSIEIDEDDDDKSACLMKDGMFEGMLEEGDWLIKVNGDYMTLYNKELIVEGL